MLHQSRTEGIKKQAKGSKSRRAFVPGRILFQGGRCLTGRRRRGITSLPQSLTVVPPNINWQRGARSECSPLLANYICMKPNIPVFHMVNAGVGGVPCFWGPGENSSCVAGDVNRDNSHCPRAAAIRTPLVRPRQQVQGCGRHLFGTIHLLMAFGKLAVADLWLGKHPK